MIGDWLAAIGGALTGIVISTVQRMYPDISLLVLLGVGMACGVLFKAVIFVAVKTFKKRS